MRAAISPLLATAIVCACGARSGLGIGGADAEVVDASVDTASSDGGDASLPDALVDGEIPDGGPPIESIAYRNLRGCVVQKNGAVKCWGHPILGNGSSSGSMSAVSVTGLLVPALKVSMNTTVTCARLQDDSAWCWGNGLNGELGPANTSALTPLLVSALGHTVIDIAMNSKSVCVAVITGGVKCWGRGDDGALGNGSTAMSATPVDVVGLVDKAIHVAVGGFFGCALLMSGGVQCWGRNYSGQLGDGTVNASSIATKPVIGLTNGIAISAGTNHACALTSGGGVKCWGDNSYGELGDGAIFDAGDDTVSTTPVDVVGLNSSVTAIACGPNLTCALRGGAVKCWGRNFSGALGSYATADQHTPADVLGVSNAIAIAEDSFGGCALMATGVARCWGYIDFNGDAGISTALDVPGLP